MKTTCPKCGKDNALIELAQEATIRASGQTSYPVGNGSRIIRCFNPDCGTITPVIEKDAEMDWK